MGSTRNTGCKERSTLLSFAALDRYIERVMVSPVETGIPGRDMVSWGDGNAYPDYLYDLYSNVPTLQSIIDGNVDYVCGDGVQCVTLPGLEPGVLNRKGETAREQVRSVAQDYNMFGGFAIQVIRNGYGQVAETNAIDLRYLRTNREADVFYYCEKWNRYGRKDVLRYPVFIPGLDWESLDEEGRRAHASSILYVRRTDRRIYPVPLYASAVKACEIERCIDDYHLNSINNGFFASMIVNFNNGVPEDSIKEEIEEDFTDKFGGAANAGRIMFSWNRSKDTATEVITPQIEDYGDRYNSLASRSRQQIFTSFRANPNLFGIPTENNGFSNEEYEESFRLYNRTQIRPVQDMITEAYGKILGKGALTITPFSLGEEGGQENG